MWEYRYKYALEQLSFLSLEEQKNMLPFSKADLNYLIRRIERN